MINCTKHGTVRGYIACTHVVSGEALPVHLIPPGDSGVDEVDLGEALCATCCEMTAEQLNDDAVLDRVRLICTGCLSTILGVGAQSHRTH
jgi:hypothetical protein